MLPQREGTYREFVAKYIHQECYVSGSGTVTWHSMGTFIYRRVEPFAVYRVPRFPATSLPRTAFSSQLYRVLFGQLQPASY